MVCLEAFPFYDLDELVVIRRFFFGGVRLLVFDLLKSLNLRALGRPASRCMSGGLPIL